MVHMVQICLDISWYILDISRLAAQDQNPAEIGHLAVKGCRQGLVWHITRENNVTHRKTCWTFSDVFMAFLSALQNVLRCSQFISVYSFCSCCAAVLLCSCCALFARCFLSLSFPTFLLLIPSFVSSSFLHFHYIHIPCLVSWCKKKMSLETSLETSLEKSWSLGFQVQI